MKIKKGFIMREVSGQNIVVAVGAASRRFDGLMRLNDTGRLMWKALEKGADEGSLVRALVTEYEVDEATARADVKAFVAKLSAEHILEP